MTQTPILEAILHPPLGLLRRELITGTFSDSGELTRPAAVLPPFNNVNAYGLTWDFFTVPAGYGFEPGVVPIADRRMLQLATTHTDFDDHELVSEWHEFRAEGVYWLWENPGPRRILYSISPGVVITFFWLVIRIP